MKWDLHVHTPDSIVNLYGGTAAWNKFVDPLEALPPEFKVLGINDYIFLDGYKRLVTEKSKGRLKNIDLLLPVIELRLDKFGGTQGELRRVNYVCCHGDVWAWPHETIPPSQPEAYGAQHEFPLCDGYS